VIDLILALFVVAWIALGISLYRLCEWRVNRDQRTRAERRSDHIRELELELGFDDYPEPGGLPGATGYTRLDESGLYPRTGGWPYREKDPPSRLFPGDTR